MAQIPFSERIPDGRLISSRRNEVSAAFR
jgi:hypothetical protein